MEILEFGNKEKQKLILIHGFQSPYQIWNDYIDYYKNSYHIIVPILQGHNPQVKEEFISMTESAREIEDYYLAHYGNEVYAIFGMSMGGLIAASIWQNGKLNIYNLIFDGSPLISYPKILKSYFINFYLDVTHKSQKRDKKTILQAVNNIISEDKLDKFLEVLDYMDDETIVKYITCWGEYKLQNNINNKKTKLYFFHGTKINELLAKRTANYLKKYYSNVKIICFKGKGHCENSLMNTDVMIKELDEIFNIEK